MYMCARMKRLIMLITLVLCGLLSTESLVAQYYSWGVDPPSFKWRQMRGEKYRVVYPDTVSPVLVLLCIWGGCALLGYLFGGIKEEHYKVLLISKSNYPIFFSNKNVDEYIEFLNK